MQKKLSEIAKLIGGKVVGGPDVTIKGVCGIKEAREGDITFIANQKYLHLLNDTRASAVITEEGVKAASKPLIYTDNPSLAFSRVVSLMAPDSIVHPVGVHKTAIVGKNVSLGKNTALGAYVVIDDNASLGENTVIYPGCFIGRGTSIGKGCIIYPNVSIRERIKIGNNVIIHSGTVIGSDGFGFVEVKGRHQKIPQIGTVEICDDVEIGANVAIDRARFDKTFIGKGTKIDNLVQIAHNVVIGENCLIVSQAGISGSTKIGNRAILAGQAGLVGHITIGDGAVVGAQGGVTKSVQANTFVSGYPARPHFEAMKSYAALQKLPETQKEIYELKKRVEGLEKKLKRE